VGDGTAGSAGSLTAINGVPVNADFANQLAGAGITLASLMPPSLATAAALGGNVLGSSGFATVTILMQGSNPTFEVTTPTVDGGTITYDYTPTLMNGGYSVGTVKRADAGSSDTDSGSSDIDESGTISGSGVQLTPTTTQTPSLFSVSTALAVSEAVADELIQLRTDRRPTSNYR
jgi:hypothetical protein